WPTGPMADRLAFNVADLAGRFAISRIDRQISETLVVSAPGYQSRRLLPPELPSHEVTVELAPDDADAVAELGGVGLGWKDLQVSYLVPGGPAERAGVAVGDQLTRIDGEPIFYEAEAIVRLRGPLGAVVELGFEREDGRELDVFLRRERIRSP